MNSNYKVNIKDIQDKYTFKIFCAGADTTEIEQEIGNLSNLTTTAKTDLVSAINEVDGNTTTNATAISGLQSGKEDKSNKVTSISSSSTDTQYPSAKCVYDSQETQNETISTLETNLEETQAELDYYKTIYNVLPKVNGNGESITLDNTGESILKLDLKGQCKQDSTTGKQLFNKNGSFALTGVSVSALNTGIRVTITTAGNFKYATYKFGESEILGKTFSYNVERTSSSSNVSSFQVFYGNSSNNAVQRITTTAGTFTIDDSFPEGCDRVNFLFYANVSGTGNLNDYADFINLMVVEGTYTSSNFPDYEPYTNGASPNPSYPQVIHEVSGDNEINVCGRNLAYTGWAEDYVSRINNSTQASIQTKDNKNTLKWTAAAGYPDYDTKYIFKTNWKENTQYTFAMDLFPTNPTSRDNLQILYTDGTFTEINSTYNTWSHIVVTSNANKTIKYICPYYRSNETYLDLDTFMVYEGTETLPYEPYNEDTYELDLGDIKMRGIGTYEDYFVRNSDGQWCKYNAIGEVVIDGSESWQTTTATHDNFTRFNLNSSPIASQNKALCDKFTIGSTSSTTTTNLLEYRDTGVIYVNTNVAQTSNEFKTWLGSNNLNVYYALATPYLSLIEDTNLINDLDKVEKALAKQGQTNISQINNDAPFKIYASALREIE